MNKLFTKIASLVLGMTMAVGVGVAVGTSSKTSKVNAEETLAATCDFTAKTTGHQTYKEEWDYDSNWKINYGANNNKGWAFMKFGSKSADECLTGAYIGSPIMTQAITKVTVSVIENTGNNKDKMGVASWKLEVYSDASYTTKIAEVDKSSTNIGVTEKATYDVVPTNGTSWAKNSYYKVIFNLTNTSSTNGVLWLDKIDFYYDNSSPTPSPTKLSTPTGLTVSGTTMSWNDVSNESGYAYLIKNTSTTDETTGNLNADVTSFNASTLSLDPGDYTFKIKATGDGTNYSDSDYTDPVNFTISSGSTSDWEETALADLSEDDIFVIVGNNGSNYAMSNDKGASSAPDAVSVTVSGDYLTSDVADTIKWTISGNSTNGYTFYPNGDTENWLYCTNTNNGVRVGTNANKTFTIDGGYLKHSGTSRYVGIYNSDDWRCYTSINSNIENQSFKFYKNVAAPVTLEEISVALDTAASAKTWYANDSLYGYDVDVTTSYSDSSLDSTITNGTGVFFDSEFTKTSVVLSEGTNNLTVYYKDAKNRSAHKELTVSDVKPAKEIVVFELTGTIGETMVGKDYNLDTLELHGYYDSQKTQEVPESVISLYNLVANPATAGSSPSESNKINVEVYLNSTKVHTFENVPAPVTNKGSVDNPYTVEEARDAITWTTNTSTSEKFYAVGYVKKVVDANNFHSYYLVDDPDDTTSTDNQCLQAYSRNTPTGFDAKATADKVVVKGYLSYHDGQKQIGASGDGNGFEIISVDPETLSLDLTVTEETVFKGSTYSYSGTITANYKHKTDVVYDGSGSRFTITSNVNTSVVGDYTYTVKYNDNLFTEQTKTCNVHVVYTDPTGVTLDKSAETIKADASTTVTATIVEASTAEQKVTWEVSTSLTSDQYTESHTNNTITITGKGFGGTITVTATTSKSQEASCVITLDNTPEIKLDETSFSGNSGDGEIYSVTATVKYLTSPVYHWSVGGANPDAIDIESAETDNTAVFTMAKGGECTISVYASESGNASRHTETVNATVTVTQSGVESVTITTGESGYVYAGNTFKLEATVNGTTGAAIGTGVTWSSDTPSVATINSSGLITGVTHGTATITAQSEFDSSKKDTFTINVVGLLNNIEHSETHQQTVDVYGYQKLSSLPSMSTGDFLQVVIAAKVGNNYYALNAISNNKGTRYSPVVTNDIIDLDKATSVYTLTKTANGYTISHTVGTATKYVKYSGDTNITDDNSAYTWTFGTAAKGTFRISSGTTGRVLAYRESTYKQFGGYSTQNITAQGTEYFDLELFVYQKVGEKIETITDTTYYANIAGMERAQLAVINYAKAFNAAVAANNTCETDPVEHTSAGWEAAIGAYNTFKSAIAQLTPEEEAHAKNMIKYASSKYSNDDLAACVEKMMETYSILVGRGYSAFMADIDPVGAVHTNPISIFGTTENTNAITIVVIVSVVSLTAIGGYFFLKKRREQN